MIKDILQENEIKRDKITELLKSSKVVISLGTNIPGTDKHTYQAYFILHFFKNILKETLTFKEVIFTNSVYMYYLITIEEEDAKTIKEKMICIEETHMIGRYIDIDVYEYAEKSLSRNSLGYRNRKCYICDKDAHECARAQAHNREIIIEDITLYIDTFIRSQVLQDIDKAIMTELELEDKYGLVTRFSSGSHSDMDYLKMVSAKNAILDYFKRMFIVGLKSEVIHDSLETVRPVAIEAEENMFQVTFGVNCYKGLIYVLGITLIACGHTLRNLGCLEDVFKNIAIISKDVLHEFNLEGDSFGYQTFRKHNITGIRGEVNKGLPSLQLVLPILYESINYSSLHKALNELIIEAEDTVLLKRSGSIDKYYEVKNIVKKLDSTSVEDIKNFTTLAIENNWSFGGSADLLIVGIYLRFFKDFIC